MAMELLQQVLDHFLAQHWLVGAVVLVAKEGKPIFANASGYADREARRPMQIDTVFRIASLSKPIAAATALAILERGIIHLDDPVNRWIPEFRPKLTDGTSPLITIRHLLTHTAGLSYAFNDYPDGPYSLADVSDGLAHPGRTMAENLLRMNSIPLLFAPGTDWMYSVGTDVLGEVLTRATGRMLPELVHQYVTGPLGMKDTGFSPPSDLERLAVPYADARPEPVRMSDEQVVPYAPGLAVTFSPSRLLDPYSFPSAGAGMVGTAPEFLFFLEILRNGGAPILSKDSVTELARNQIGDLEIDKQQPGWRWGYGFSILEDPSRIGTPQARGTWQWGGIYGHHWFVDPQRNLSVVVMTNTAVAGTSGAFPVLVCRAIYADLQRQQM